MDIFRAWKALFTRTQLEAYGFLVWESVITGMRVVSPGFECLVIICALHVLMYPEAVSAGKIEGITVSRFSFTPHKSQVVVCFDGPL